MDLKYLFKEAKYYQHLDGGLWRIGIKYLFAKTPLKKLVNTSIYNKIYGAIVKSKIKKQRPYILHIENTNICNAKCIMCPHVFMKRKNSVMSQKNFEKIIKNVAPYEKIKYVTITGFGEPLADKGVIEKIKWLNKNYPKYQVVFYTNASLLTKEITEELLKLDILKINFSINGTKNSYKKIMALDYDKTVENIMYFLKRKKEVGKKFPLTNVSSMLIKDNKGDMEEFKKFWMDKVDSVMIYLPSDWAGAVDVGVVDKIPFKFKRWPCPILWKWLSVDVEGNIIMCCRDYESKIVFGNLLKKNIREIREGKEWQELMQKQARFDYNTPICNKCDNCFDSSLDWWN